MKEEFEIVSFSRNQMRDFYDFILPDVYTELLGIDEFANEGVIAVGALHDGEPCGAAVCVYASADTYSLISIIVDDSLRRNGCGRLLLDAAVNEALSLTSWQGEENPIKKLELKTEYAMHENEIDGMDKFLSAYGFRDFSESSPMFLWKASEAGCDLVPISPFTKLPEEELDEISSLEESGLSPEPELSFFTENENGVSCIFITNPAGENTYIVTSAVNGEIESSDFEKAFLTILKKIADADKDATVIAPSEIQAYPDVLENLAEKNGSVCLHKEASCYVLLQTEENK